MSIRRLSLTILPTSVNLPRVTTGGSLTTGTNGLQPATLSISTNAVEDARVPTLDDLLTADPDQFVATYTDIAAVNLACARGLPNCDESEFPKYLALLDTIAEAVRRQTEKNFRLFKLKAAQFNNSEGVYRLYTMEHVFRIQFGIKYDPVVREATKNGGSWNTTDSTEIFVHGLLSAKRTGTCSSLPTFAIAVGRRLGYPLTLILVPNHTLYRWDDGKEVFNLQPNETGGEVKSDEYFYEWPRKWNDVDHQMNARTKVWLHSLMPKQEVSKYLCNRALMLRETRRYDEAIQALDAAERFDPINPACTDIRISIEYVMAGGDIPAFLSGNGPKFLGGSGVSSTMPSLPPGTDPKSFSCIVGGPTSPWVEPLQQGLKTCSLGPPVSSFVATSGDHPSPRQSSLVVDARVQEAQDFSLEHARLVQLINESNRNRSAKHPNGNPPTEPLFRQLTQMLLNRKGQ